MTPYKELTAWIKEHSKKFTAEGYSTDDIVRLSIACGFNRSAVAQWQTQQSIGKVA